MLIAQPVADMATPKEILMSWNGQSGWRWMFWAELFPAGAFLVLMFLALESPRFLAKVKQYDKISRIFSKIGGLNYAQNALNEIKGSLKESSAKISIKPLFDKKIGAIVALGIVLAAFQQWCGINVVAMVTVDRWERRKLMLFGAGGLAIAVYAMSLAPMCG